MKEQEKPRGKLVVYRAYDGHATLICAPVDEKYMFRHWFAKHTGRDRKAYFRFVSKGVINVETRMTATPEDYIVEEDRE